MKEICPGCGKLGRFIYRNKQGQDIDDSIGLPPPGYLKYFIPHGCEDEEALLIQKKIL